MLTWASLSLSGICVALPNFIAGLFKALKHSPNSTAPAWLWYACLSLGLCSLAINVGIASLHGVAVGGVLTPYAHDFFWIDHTRFCLRVLPWIVLASTHSFFSAVLLLFVGAAWADDRREKQNFFAANGDTPLSRAALRIKMRAGSGIWPILGMLCCVLLGVSASSVFGLSGYTLQQRSDLLLTQHVTVLVLSLCLVACLGIAGLVRKYKNSPVSTLVKLNKVGSWIKTRLEPLDNAYEELPCAEKAALLTRAQQLGVDPEDHQMKRAAVRDYRVRQTQALIHANQIDNATQTAACGRPSVKRL